MAKDRATGNCNPSITAVRFLVDKQQRKGLIPAWRKERSALAHVLLCCETHTSSSDEMSTLGMLPVSSHGPGKVLVFVF